MTGSGEDGLAEFSISPSDREFCQNPYPAYSEMRQLGQAFFWREYGFPCFSRYSEVDTILRDRRFGREVTHVMSRQEAGLGNIPDHLVRFYDFEANSMLEREPPVHTRLRKLVNRAFVARNIAALAPAIARLANELVDAFPAGGEIDLLPAFCEPIPVIVIADLLGVPRDMSGQLLEWSHAMVAMYQFNRDRRTEDDALAAMDAFSFYVRSLVTERRRKPRADLLTALVEAHDEGEKLSEDELVTTVILLLNAGHEATVHAFANGIKAVMEGVRDQTRLLSDPQATPRIVDELLRFDPPLHLFTRYVLEDLEIGGIRLSRGQKVGLLLASANRDERKYERPDLLDFDRGGEGHVSFGAGIHFCVGAPLARLEMATALPVLFSRMRTIMPARDLVYADRYHFHGLEALPVKSAS